MKLLHLADLHLGKRLKDYSLYEDQLYILKQVLDLIDQEQPQVVLLAGDIYDKAVPSEEAINLFEYFLEELSARNLQVAIISGNHDSGTRLAFGSRFMAGSGLHFAGTYLGEQQPQLVLEDEHGPVNFYLLPFLRPGDVRYLLKPEEKEAIKTYHDAVAYAVSHYQLQENQRNVLLSHQFVAGAEASANDVQVGGLENIGKEVYEPFDYVALGHIHRSQSLAANLRYAGTMLVFGAHEVGQAKTVTLVDLGPKGQVAIKEHELKPLRPVLKLRGTLAQLKEQAKLLPQEAYVYITLTEPGEILEPMAKVRNIFPKVLQLEFDNEHTRALGATEALEALEQKEPIDLLREFYEKQTDSQLDSFQLELLESIIERAGEA